MRRRSLLQLPLALAPIVAAGPALAAPRAATGDVHLAAATRGTTWVSHAVRHGDGSWDRFNPLHTDLPVAENMASTVADGELHLVHQVVIGPKPSLLGTYLQTRHLDGSWSWRQLTFSYNNGDHGIAVVNGELHVLKQDSADMYHYVRYRDGSWSPLMRFPRPGYGASLANVNGVLHLMVYGGDSNTVLRLLTWQDGSWSEPVDTAVLPQPRGWEARANIAQVGTDLHAVVRTSDRALLHAIRRPDGSWTAWGDIGQEAGVPGLADAISVTASRNTLHVLITTTDGGLFHTIRFADGTWQRFGDVFGVAGQVHAHAVTIAGE